MKKVIWFDMDGTILDLYGVENWLDYLRAYNPKPYIQAGTMLNMNILARYLNLIQKQGYELGIISWLSRNSTPAYDEAVTKAKLNSLKKHLKSVKWNYIHIVAYGTPKENFMKNKTDILFDDEEKNRKNWHGKAYTPDQIISVLKQLMAH